MVIVIIIIIIKVTILSHRKEAQTKKRKEMR